MLVTIVGISPLRDINVFYYMYLNTQDCLIVGWMWCVHSNSSLLSDLIQPQYIILNLLTSWSRVLLEKLTGSQLVKKFPTFYGTGWFITAFTSGRQLSLS